MKFSLDSFLKTGHKIDYKKNEHILRQGQVSRRVLYVQEGIVRHYVTDFSGVEKTIRISAEKDFFYSSNVSFWTGNPSYINCQALSNCKLLYWTKKEIEHLSNTEPSFLAFESRKLKDFIIEKHNKEILQITQNSENRLLQFNKESIELFNRIPHHIIASYLDMTPETLSRIRAKLRNQKS